MTPLFLLPLLFGKIGGTELLIIIILLLIFFGGKKIPELMRGMGRGVREFKDALNKDYSAEEKEKVSGDKAESTGDNNIQSKEEQK